MNEQIQKNDCDVEKRKLIRIFEHAKYAYKEEKERRDILNQMSKMYLWAMLAAIGIGIIKIGSISKFSEIMRDDFAIDQRLSSIMSIGKPLLLVSIALLLMAFVLTTLVVKMWKRERLCNIKSFVDKTISMRTEEELLSAIIADFVVATGINYEINERKAKLLSLGMVCFLTAFILISALTFFTLIFIP